MKLSDIKSVMIEKFFNEVKPGVSLEEGIVLIKSTAEIISESAKAQVSAILEAADELPVKTDSPDKAFDYFSNGKFNAIMSIDESEEPPKVVYLAVKEYRNCSHINCTEGSPIPTSTTVGAIKIALSQLKALNEDVVFFLGNKK